MKRCLKTLYTVYRETPWKMPNGIQKCLFHDQFGRCERTLEFYTIREQNREKKIVILSSSLHRKSNICKCSLKYDNRALESTLPWKRKHYKLHFILKKNSIQYSFGSLEEFGWLNKKFNFKLLGIGIRIVDGQRMTCSELSVWKVWKFVEKWSSPHNRAGRRDIRAEFYRET